MSKKQQTTEHENSKQQNKNLISYHILYLFFCDCCSCHHVLPVCTSPPPRTVMLILIFNSTAYCHAHSLILYILYSVFYILFFIHFILCILPLLYSTIFALSMERTWFTFHCWLYNLCIVVYVTNKTWNLKLDEDSQEKPKHPHSTPIKMK